VLKLAKAVLFHIFLRSSLKTLLWRKRV